MLSLVLLQLTGGALLVAERTFFPVFASDIGMSAAAISGVSGARQLLGMVAALVGGHLANRVGRKWTYFLGNLGFLLAGLLFFGETSLSISILWITSGFLVGLRALGGQSYLVAAAPPEQMGTMSALFTWGTTLGGAGGTFGLGLLLDRTGYFTFAWSLVIGAALVLTINALLMPRLKQPATVGSRAFTGYRSVIRNRNALLLTFLRFLPTFYWGMAVVLVPLRLLDLEAATVLIATYGTVSQVVASVAQMITGRAADRTGPRRPSVIILSLLALSIVATALFSGSLAGVFVASTIAAAAAWSMSALVPVLVSSSVPSDGHAHTLGWIHLWWNIGMVSGAWIGGALYEISPWLPFLVAGILNLTTPAIAARLSAGSASVEQER